MEAKPGAVLLDVRRLVAVDLHGWKGTRRRRLIVLAEFVGGAVLGLALGLWVELAAGNVGWGLLLGIWLIGVGANYVALTLNALPLLGQAALTNEVGSLDLSQLLKRYRVRSLWLVAPFLVAVLAVVQRRGTRHGS